MLVLIRHSYCGSSPLAIPEAGFAGAAATDFCSLSAFWVVAIFAFAFDLARALA
jgi:hypothetical protein